MDVGEIPIRLANGHAKAWIRLSGTVLAYREQQWSQETSIDIPVELITISEKRRFMVSRLITALLTLLLAFVIGQAITRLPFYMNIAYDPTLEVVCRIIAVIVIIVPSIVMFVRFLFRQTSISLKIAPNSAEIAFWMEKRNKDVIRQLISEIKRGQEYVHDKIAYPLRLAIGDVSRQPWKRTIVLVCLFATPGLLAEIPALLFAGLIPVGFHIYQRLRSLRQPPLFRSAVRSCLKKKWNEAIKCLDRLATQEPSFVPAKLLKIDICLRLNNYAEASSLLDQIHAEIDTEVLQAIQTSIVDARRMHERKQIRVQQSAEAYSIPAAAQPER